MSSDLSNPTIPFSPFLLLIPHATQGTLVLLPTPIAISLPSYRALYSSLHASSAFCTMAFAHHFLPRTWSDAETKDVIQTRDIERCWDKRGMGDFALGIIPPELNLNADTGRPLREAITGVSTATSGQIQSISIVEGSLYKQTIDENTKGAGLLEAITWIGYAGVRDATTTSMPISEYTHSELAALPHWKEMIEVRYGVAPEYWGKGIAKPAADAVMLWAEKEMGVTRFVAETEKGNARSGRVLEKMGFVASGTNYWKEDSEMEWEKVVI